jgi:hypothetical protein
MNRLLIAALAGVIGVAGCGSEDPGDPANGGSGGSQTGTGGGGGSSGGTGGSGGTSATGGSGGGASTGGSGGGAATGGTGGGTGGMGGGTTPGASMFPLAVGNTWTYQVKGSDGTFTKTQRVDPMERVGGAGPHKDKMAYKLTTTKGDGPTADKTVSWQAWDGTKLVRYREVTYAIGTDRVSGEFHWNPPRLRYDSSKTGKWTEMFDEFELDLTRTPATPKACSPTCAKMEGWTLLATATVPVTIGGKATPIQNCAKVQKVGNSMESEKTYWFCPGIGKVREVGKPGSSQEEVLTGYTVK